MLTTRDGPACQSHVLVENSDFFALGGPRRNIVMTFCSVSKN